MTVHAAYAAGRISPNLKGSTKQFGWLQAPATIFWFRYDGLGGSTPEPFSFLGAFGRWNSNSVSWSLLVNVRHSRHSGRFAGRSVPCRVDNFLTLGCG
jgi:hypothetical protein